MNTELANAIHHRSRRAFQTMMRRTARLAEIAHPETGGNELFVHNWGNAEARRHWAEGWRRWDAMSAEFDRRYRAAMGWRAER